MKAVRMLLLAAIVADVRFSAAAQTTPHVKVDSSTLEVNTHKSQGIRPLDLSAEGALSWSTDSVGPRRFVAVHGHRSAIFGYSQMGLELWAYPVQILSEYRVAFLQRGATREIDGQAMLSQIEYRPESITRLYVGPDFVVREKLFVPLDEPGAIITYETSGARQVDIVIRIVPSLDLMWPASVGGQWTTWDQNASAYVLGEPSSRFSASIGSPDIIAHDDTANPALSLVRPSEFAFTVRPPTGAHVAHVVMASGSPSEECCEALAHKLLATASQLENEARTHYSEMIKSTTQIETPDDDVNRALLWSKVAVDQQWVCTTGLGCAEVAGFGPSRAGRRPQYDWFFEDGLSAVLAYLADGEYDRAKQELEFIQKYQDPKSGMVWHEISLSAPFMDWDKTQSFFAGIGPSFGYLSTSAAYVSATGDRKFLAEHWPSYQAAYRYCLSVIGDKDGLPFIPPGKVGDNEEDDDRGDSINVALGWVAAANAYAELATQMGDSSAAIDARRRREQAQQSIISHFWDEQQHRWVNAHTRSGRPSGDGELPPAGALHNLPVTTEQRDAMLDLISATEFQTDWGIRSKSPKASTYDPNLYFAGSVWSAGTSETVTALWEEHRPIPAMTAWYALVPWSSLDSLGHMPEVLAADFYHEETEAVPEQLFSSSEFFSAACRGWLGLKIEGGAHRMTFAPHLAPNWDFVKVSHQRVGQSNLTFRLEQTVGQLHLELDNDGPDVEVLFDPEIPLGATTPSAQVGGKAIAVRLDQNPQDTHAEMEFSVPRGHTSLTVHFRGGVAIYPPLPMPKLGAPTRGLKVTNVGLTGRRLTVDLEHASPEFSSFVLRTAWNLNRANGAHVEDAGRNLYKVTVAPPTLDADPEQYHRARVVLDFGTEN